MKKSMSNNELTRLIKIHSIEKLNILEQLKNTTKSGQKKKSKWIKVLSLHFSLIYLFILLFFVNFRVIIDPLKEMNISIKVLSKIAKVITIIRVYHFCLWYTFSNCQSKNYFAVLFHLSEECSMWLEFFIFEMTPFGRFSISHDSSAFRIATLWHYHQPYESYGNHDRQKGLWEYDGLQCSYLLAAEEF